MTDLWTALEQRSRDWAAMDRQNLADVVWDLYVPARFGRTGDPRALDYLYPYLNHADRAAQIRAIRVVAQVFEGRGERALEALQYVTQNPRNFLKDRAVSVVGAALFGTSIHRLIPVMEPYLDNRNTFIKRLAVEALGVACRGTAHEEVLDLIDTHGRAWPEVQDMAIARVYAGQPNDTVYERLKGRVGSQHHVAMLIAGAGVEWFDRAYVDEFQPLVEAPPEKRRLWQRFKQRAAVHAISRGGKGLGMHALSKMIHLVAKRAPGHAMMSGRDYNIDPLKDVEAKNATAQNLFLGADYPSNKKGLMDLLENGDVPTQRVAAGCIGRLAVDSDDTEVVDRLVTLAGSRNGAVKSSALFGLGLASYSSCDERLAKICYDATSDDQTSKAAYWAIGRLFSGSGRADVFERLSDRSRKMREKPIRRSASRPLASCYRAMGAVYKGTGSAEPFTLLMDVLSLPKHQGYDVYRRASAQALVDVEFGGAH